MIIVLYNNNNNNNRCYIEKQTLDPDVVERSHHLLHNSQMTFISMICVLTLTIHFDRLYF